MLKTKPDEVEDCDTVIDDKMLKFDLGISNDLASLLYLPLVSGDNNFTCRSAARQMPSDTLAVCMMSYFTDD
jgi:hypothetical protein